LISEDTGCYGLDIGTSLAELLGRLLVVGGEFKLIVIDYNPCWLLKQREDLLPLFEQYQDKIKELFVPVQSGSDRILKRMCREYTSDDVGGVLREINKKAPRIALRTSLLVGFPGETDDDFEATREFITGVRFDEVTVNRYEDRPNTPSSRMTDKVQQETVEHRAQVLAKEMGCRILS
jgi:tRNA A37 methylthiotransferase MiaB